MEKINPCHLTYTQLRQNLHAKYKKNRVVYITPQGIHTVYDIEPGVAELTMKLKAEGFEVRATNQRTDAEGNQFFTADYFKHGEGDWWESYVITQK